MERLIVITTYPPKDSIHGNRFSAVASYAKNTLSSIKKSSKEDIDLVVISEVLDEKTSYEEDGIKVFRQWRRNSLSIFNDLLKIISKFPQHKKILFEFEFGMFGGNKYLIALFPLFIAVLRLMGKQVYLVCHGVILTSDEVSVQLGLEASPLKRFIFNIGLKITYLILMTLSTRIIVFEQYLKNRLIKVLHINEKKIFVVSHGVELSRSHIEKSNARKILIIKPNEFVVVCFGFLIWYKGSDWLIESFSKLHRNKEIPANAKLIMAGGFSATHKEDPIYKNYIDKTKKLVEDSNGVVVLTDFIPEDKIDLYFSAADLLVLPHRVLISASGPFSFVISHEKPFILSESLAGYKLNKDFSEAVSQMNLNEKDIFFSQSNNNDIKDLINRYSSDKIALSKLSDVSKNLLKERNWNVIGAKYYEIIFK